MATPRRTKQTTTSPPTSLRNPVVTIVLTAKMLAENPQVMRATIDLLTAMGMHRESA
jgi:hypothetical protein